MSKPFWKSKTLWFNLLMAIVTIATEVMQVLDQAATLGFSDAVIDQVQVILTVIVIVGGTFLRLITDSAVTLK